LKAKYDADRKKKDEEIAKEKLEAQLKAIDDEETRKNALIDAKLAERLIDQEEYEQQLLDMRIEMAGKRLEADPSNPEAMAELSALNGEKTAKANEKAINGLDKYGEVYSDSEQTFKDRNKAVDDEFAAIEDLKNRKILTEEEYTDRVKQLTQERKDLAEEERDHKNAMLQSVGDAMGELGDIIGEQTAAGKALNIANAIMNAYVGISEIWRAKSVLPEPFGTAQKVASTAIAAASAFKAVKGILAVKVPKEKGTAIQAPAIQSTLLNIPQQQIGLAAANANQQPLRAFIVENDLSTREQRNKFVNRQNTIG
jgi:hypothetical protein